MQLTLYDVTRLNDPLGRPMLDAVCPVLQVIKYTSKIGPAFIWSAEFSKDGEAIILGCWSGAAFVRTTLSAGRSKKVVHEQGRSGAALLRRTQGVLSQRRS